MKRSKNQNAFTLIEIMLVVIILGVLVAMVVPNLAGRGEQARRAAAAADIESNLSTALDLYEFDNGRYPTTEQGLAALMAKPVIAPEASNWNGPYLKKKKIPKDPWGKEYIYVCPGANNPEGYDLSSAGKDGIQSADDVVNWAQEKN